MTDSIYTGTDRRTVEVELFRTDNLYSDVPDTLDEFVDFVMSLKHKVPVGCKGWVDIDCSNSGYEGDGSYVIFRVGYSRPETDKEYNDRLKKEAKITASRRTSEMKMEMAQLKMLAKKYGMVLS